MENLALTCTGDLFDQDMSCFLYHNHADLLSAL